MKMVRNTESCVQGIMYQEGRVSANIIIISVVYIEKSD